MLDPFKNKSIHLNKKLKGYIHLVKKIGFEGNFEGHDWKVIGKKLAEVVHKSFVIIFNRQINLNVCVCVQILCVVSPSVDHNDA